MMANTSEIIIFIMLGLTSVQEFMTDFLKHWPRIGLKNHNKHVFNNRRTGKSGRFFSVQLLKSSGFPQFNREFSAWFHLKSSVFSVPVSRLNREFPGRSGWKDPVFTVKPENMWAVIPVFSGYPVIPIEPRTGCPSVVWFHPKNPIFLPFLLIF